MLSAPSLPGSRVRRTLRGWLAGVLFFLVSALAAQAVVPNAPSGLRGAVTGSSTLSLIFDDNSTDETNFEVLVTGGTSGGTITYGSSPGRGTISTGRTGLTANTTYTYKVRAYITNTSAGNVSAYSNTITITTADFNDPNSPAAVLQANGAVLVTWTDNAYSEAGYYVEYGTTAVGPWTLAGATGVSFTGFNMTGLAPAATFYFRVRGFKGTSASPTAVTGYSAVVSATTPAVPATPTALVATPVNETNMNLTFADNTVNNTGYEVFLRPAGGAFTYLGDAGDVTTINTGSILAPGSAYDFMVRAYYQNGANPRVYSLFSNTATATTPFYAPTNLTATPSAATPYQISFSWTDNSSAEDSYELEYRKQGAAFFSSRKVVAANVTGLASLPEFEPGTVYEFRVRARAGNVPSAYFPASGGVAATTRDGFTSKPYAPIQTGTFFSYQMTTQSLALRTGWSVGAGTLPPGLSFNSTTGVISGTPTTAGVYAVPMTATFASGPAHTLNLVLRILPPLAAPQITAAISAQTLTQGGSGAVALDTKFADPDTESAVRMATTKGNVDLVFYANTTPQTVANFLTYNYSDVIFHRAPAGFVLQGGGFKTYAAPDVFEHLATPATVPNEPGISNTLGTVAMAKVGDNPDSATSEFFINLGDNSANLDNQNGGFTVFGRVAAPSLGSTVAALAAVPVGNYGIGLHVGPLPTDIVGSSLTDLPQDQTPVPATVDQSKLLKITSVTALPVLTFAVTGNTNPSAASAAVVGNSVQFSGLAPGVASITVTATDVDGNVTPQTFTITVQQTFAQWAAALGVPGSAADNPDRDALTNLQEWAFFGNPTVSDTAAHLPALALTPVAGAKFLEITFPVRKYAANLTYSVEASGTLLPGDWTVLWSSAQGFATPAVTAAVDQTDRTIVTVRDSASSPTAARRYLRAKVQ